MHGAAGTLSFNGVQKYSNDIKSLKKIKTLRGKIYLLSCNGGTTAGDGSSVAGAFAVLQKGVKVRAVVDGKVYYRAWNQLISRKPLTKELGAYWADFIYCKYRGKLCLMYSSIGREWYYG